MNYIAPFRLRIEKNIITRINRILPYKGEIKVQKGQMVSPDEIIGSSFCPSGFRIVNLAKELSVSPQEVGKYLSKNLNQRIYKGELLAFKKGSFLSGKKVVTAPTDGLLEFLNPKTGELKISFFPKKINLPAGVFGFVEEIDQARGHLLIRTEVSRIHGVFGVGKPREGILHILGNKDELYSDIKAGGDSQEHILVGGSLFFKDAISQAISSGIKGLITGGINARDYKAMSADHIVFPKKLDNDVGISIIVCEGFGPVPISDEIFNMLLAYDGKFVFIEGNKGIINLPSFSSASLKRVESFHLPKSEIQDQEGKTELKIGLKVRIIGNSYFGTEGIILAIDNSETLLPSGLKSILGTIETPRKKIKVPVANLEAIV